MEYKYTGIILNKFDVGETDRFYTIFTLEAGKIRSIAKGVRKPHAKLASSLESLTLADLTIVKNRGNGKIAGSIVENSYANLKKDGELLLDVFGGVALFNRMVDLENKDEKLFELLSEYLEAANENALLKVEDEKNKLLTLGFSIKLLELLGYKIEADICVLGSCVFSGEKFYFSSEHGGVVCHQCGNLQKGMLPISANTIKILRIFFKNKLNSFKKLKVEKKELDNLQRLLQGFLAWSL